MDFFSWFIVIFVFFGAILLIYGFSQLFPTNSSNKAKQTKKGVPGEMGTCPVCASLLRQGEQLKSALFPGKNDRLCHIFGCPHCYPYAENKITRICPVCRHEIPSEGYLIARMFNRNNKKNHVHILGCVNCRRPRR